MVKKKNESLDGKKYTNMFKAYRAFWLRGYSDWTGRSSRSEYWWTELVNLIIVLCWGAVYVGIAKNSVVLTPGYVALVLGVSGLLLLYLLVAFVPSLSLVVRRLRDAGLGLWWALLVPAGFLPYIGNISVIILLILMLCPPRESQTGIIKKITDSKWV